MIRFSKLKSLTQRRPLPVIAAIALAGILAWAYMPAAIHPGLGLKFQWEGMFESSLNFRDAGQSINQCLGHPLLPEGKLFRASGFFSGWSCSQVGNPETIYSLNFSTENNNRGYCRASSGLVIGQSFQSEEISDIEFVETWDNNATMVKAVCAHIHGILGDLAAEKRVLVHCAAGRDRTGAVTALAAGWLLESQGPLTDSMIAAIECDYRRSSSLDATKYGRITRFLTTLREKGGVRHFLRARCGTP